MLFLYMYNRFIKMLSLGAGSATQNIMKKILCVCVCSFLALAANAQFTIYTPGPPQQQNYQNDSDCPFTIYTPGLPQNNVPREQNLNIVRAVYLNLTTNDAEYIKLKVADVGNQKFIKAYYNKDTGLWFKCNVKVIPLGIMDDAELRNYFSYKAMIYGIGTVYY